jgi:hypothetical protein
MSRGGRTALRYLDAARQMRLRQLLARPRRLVPPRLLALGVGGHEVRKWESHAAGLGVDPAPQSGPGRPPHLTREVRAYGHARRFGQAEFWAPGAEGLLFAFHLHGFAPLAEYAAGARDSDGDAFWAEVVDDWLRSQDVPRLPAWHPFPTSVRAVAWSAALAAIDTWPARLRLRVATAIRRQGAYLRRCVEHDIGGNHVLKNATALVYAGATTRSAGLIDAGVRLLRTELDEQFLADGGHEERSTSYHRQATSDLADVAELLRRARGSTPSWLEEALARARGWQAAMAGPDGMLPLLNDAWEGPPVDGAGRSACDVLEPSGYVVLREGRDQATLDVGPLCPPHLPPHAHADALSFVLWVDGRPLVVDPGSFAYTGPERDRFRGTAAHNTVQVDGLDQCEFWGDFRAAALPRVEVAPLERHGDVVIARAAHDGYRRLSDPVRHERVFAWWPGVGMVVLDRLRARDAHQARSRLHLAPEIPRGDALAPAGLEVSALGAASLAVVDGRYSPALGRSVEIAVLEQLRRVAPDEPFGWSILRPGHSADLVPGGVELTAGATVVARIGFTSSALPSG